MHMSVERVNSSSKFVTQFGIFHQTVFTLIHSHGVDNGAGEMTRKELE